MGFGILGFLDFVEANLEVRVWSKRWHFWGFKALFVSDFVRKFIFGNGF